MCTDILRLRVRVRVGTSYEKMPTLQFEAKLEFHIPVT